MRRLFSGTIINKNRIQIKKILLHDPFLQIIRKGMPRKLPHSPNLIHHNVDLVMLVVAFPRLDSSNPQGIGQRRRQQKTSGNDIFAKRSHCELITILSSLSSLAKAKRQLIQCMTCVIGHKQILIEGLCSSSVQGC